jgi:hypothetical protein
MMAIVATISFVLLLTVVYLIARPFLLPQVETATAERAIALHAERDRAAAQLHDLDMEFSTGKLAEIDYRTQRERREADLEAAERELGELLDDEEVVTFDEDDDLERVIADRRQELARAACPTCATPHDPDDRFCRSCGGELSEVTTQ